MTKRIRRRPVQTPATPVRAALKAGSALQGMVKDGIGAITDVHRDYFDVAVRPSFADSLDIDRGLKQGREQENRWDYLLGHRPSGRIVGVEPHSAENSEIFTVIKKRAAARSQLQDHLRDGARVSEWFWVASGKVHLAPMETARFRLAQNGITFVGRKILRRHLI